MPKSASQENQPPVKESQKWLTFEYAVQNVGGIVLMIIVLLGMVGLFSDGVLSTTRAVAPGNGLTVEYEKIGRIDSDMNIKIALPATAGDITVTIGGEWMEANEVKTLFPLPVLMQSQNGALVLQYHARPAAPLAIWLGVTPRHAGLHRYTVQSGDNTLTINQFILP